MYRVTAKNTETTVGSAGEAIATAELYEDTLGETKIESECIDGQWREITKAQLVALVTMKQEGGAA